MDPRIPPYLFASIARRYFDFEPLSELLLPPEPLPESLDDDALEDPDEESDDDEESPEEEEDAEEDSPLEDSDGFAPPPPRA